MRRTLTAAFAAATLVTAGCGGDYELPTDPGAAVRDVARVARDISQVERAFLAKWCPDAFTNGGRDLTTPGARACLRKAKEAYLAELRKVGYDPEAIARGK